MVDEYAESRGMRVVGLYIARDGGEGLGRTGERILGKLKENYAGAFGLEVSYFLLLLDFRVDEIEMKLMGRSIMKAWGPGRQRTKSVHFFDLLSLRERTMS